MQPKVHAHDDGSVTISITLPRASDELSMFAQEGRLMEALNAVGRAGARHLLGGFDAQGQPLLHAGRKWTSKGKVAKFYETPWGEVLLERHLYQHSGGGVTLCPLEERARIVGGTATPHLARSLGHKYANANARAVVRDLEENHARKLAPSYVADIAQAIAGAAGQPVVEQNAHAPQSAPGEVASTVLSLDGTCALFCGEGFKQCMVGTIALYDGAGERLETIYLGQAPETGKAEFLDRLDGEWQRICKRYPKARRVGLSDGARDYEPWLAARTQWQILDFYPFDKLRAFAGTPAAIWPEPPPASSARRPNARSSSRSPATRSSTNRAPPGVWPMNSPHKSPRAAAPAAPRRRWKQPAATLPITSNA